MFTNLTLKPSVLDRFIAEMRSAEIQLDPMRFRRNMERIGEITAYEISKELSFSQQTVDTPLGTAQMELLDRENIVIATILRAGVPYHQGFMNYFDSSPAAFIAAYRKTHKDNSFEVKVDYISSGSIEGKTLILVDPMLATGSSFVLAYNALCEKCGTPSHTHIASIIASEQGVEYIKENMNMTTTSIWVGAVDEELTSKSYIVPGIGDAGDLAYGTKL